MKKSACKRTFSCLSAFEEISLDHFTKDVGRLFKTTRGTDTCIIDPNVDMPKGIGGTLRKVLH
jgi:hypothetical protein